MTRRFRSIPELLTLTMDPQARFRTARRGFDSRCLRPEKTVRFGHQH
jgi:hypothetical protein